MTIANLIAYVDDIKPNSFSNETKTIWINDVEGIVQTDIMLIALDDVISYNYTDDSAATLLVAAPHDKLYRSYLVAMVDFANGEYDKYQNTLEMFNAQMNEYAAWYIQKFRPADGQCEKEGYYISAYGIAVKNGYMGTEAEWLLSLKGNAGAKGDRGEGFIIYGMYTTLAALEAAVTAPDIGDAYAVGTNLSNVIYIWDGDYWYSIGTMRGEKGDTGETGATGPTGLTGATGATGGTEFPEFYIDTADMCLYVTYPDSGSDVTFSVDEDGCLCSEVTV